MLGWFIAGLVVGAVAGVVVRAWFVRGAAALARHDDGGLCAGLDCNHADHWQGA